ncbi:MAG: class I SAM-dependent methyltransferase [Pararhizobium sp.]
MPTDGDTVPDPRLMRFIRDNLPLAPLPTLPEIRLHRAVPESGLRRLLAERGETAIPYWAYAWGGGLALARHVLDVPQTVLGRRVVDLGTGSGLVAIAAARAGAAAVTAVDIDPAALSAATLNAAANGVRLDIVIADLTAGPPPAADIVLVGDLFYERALALRVLRFLDGCLGAGLDVLVGDPWRLHLPKERLRLVAEYRVHDFGRADASPSAVFALAPAAPPDAK